MVGKLVIIPTVEEVGCTAPDPARGGAVYRCLITIWPEKISLKNIVKDNQPIVAGGNPDGIDVAQAFAGPWEVPFGRWRAQPALLAISAGCHRQVAWNDGLGQRTRTERLLMQAP